MKRSLVLFIERHTRLGRGLANRYLPDFALKPWSWFHSVLLRSNLEEYRYASLRVSVEGSKMPPNNPVAP